MPTSSSTEALEFIDPLLGYEHVVLLPVSHEVATRLVSLLKTAAIKGPRVGTDFKEFSDIETLEPTPPQPSTV